MSTDELTTEESTEEAATWRPGDPDRRKSSRSLLDLTSTTADEHRPDPDRRTGS